MTAAELYRGGRSALDAIVEAYHAKAPVVDKLRLCNEVWIAVTRPLPIGTEE